MIASVEPTEEDDDVYDDNGVDRTVVRWFLSLSPYERLAALDDALRFAELAGGSGDPAA